MQFGLDTKTTFAKLKLEPETGSPGQRRAKVFSNKLPRDFFGDRIYANSVQKKRPSFREQTQTQRANRKTTILQRKSQTRGSEWRQGSQTSRTQKEQPTTINLIMGIIQSTRSINKQIHKHSVELRRQTTNLLNDPESLAWELPPLKLKKGFSLN